MKEELLYTAIDKFNQMGMLNCKVVDTNFFISTNYSEAMLLFENATFCKKYRALVKRQILPIEIPEIEAQQVSSPPYILVANYITTQAKELLKTKGIAYLDTAGNSYIKDSNLLIYIENNKSNRIKLTTTNRAFSKAGLKVVYQFLVNPTYLNKPYRLIGSQAQVTIDTVGRVITTLLKEKYIVKEDKKKYTFIDRPKLFQNWVTAFNSVLRPKLKQKSYRLVKPTTNFKNIKLPQNAYWGGAVAAEIITDHLIADKAIIYTDLPFITLSKKLQLIPDTKGDIQLLEIFWAKKENNNIVNSMLVYADLLNEFNPRYLETATKTYEKDIQNKL